MCSDLNIDDDDKDADDNDAGDDLLWQVVDCRKIQTIPIKAASCDCSCVKGAENCCRRRI